MIYGDKLKKVQEIELDILKKVMQVCNENNIEYFILGGTLLGAVRHNGFIPWDDDIDIGMTRNNYNKFISIANENLADDLFLQTFHSEPDSPFYFAKIRKNGTKFIESYCKKLNINHGVFIDVFPYDNIPDDVKLREKQLKKVKFWSNLFIAKSVSGSSTSQDTFIGKLKVGVRTIAHFLLKSVSKKFLFEKLDFASQEYNNISCKMKSFIKYTDVMIPSIDLNNLETIEFEGISVSCPRNVKAYLKYKFGDYMTLPPENKRVGHRPCKLEL